MPLFPVITAWLFYICKEPLRRNPALYTVCILQTLKAAAVSAYYVTDAYYNITGISDVKNPFSYITPIFGILFFIVIVTLLVRRWKKLTTSQRIFFVICDFMTSEWLILFIVCFLIYDQNRRNLKNKEEIIRQQEEIIRQKENLVKRETQVAVLQMRPHIALENIRKRLKTMCGGSLETTPREDGGTRVIIRIPNSNKKH